MSTKKFYKTTLLLGSTYALIAVFNLVKQKIIAHYTGLNGMGILGLLNRYLYLLYTVGSLTIFNGITKFISEYQAKNDKDSISKLFSTVWSLMILFSIPLTLVLCVFAGYFSQHFLGSASFMAFFIIVTVSLPFYIIWNVILAAYKGFQDFRGLALVQLISAALGVFLTVVLIVKYNINGLVISLTVSMVILAFISILSAIFLQKEILYPFHFQIHKPVFDYLIRFSGTVFSTNLLHYGVQFFITIQIVRLLGMDNNGAIQAAVYFSMYSQIIQDALTTYLFPRLSELIDNEQSNAEINTSVRLTGLMTIPAVSLILLFMHPLVKLLLTKDFYLIESLMLFIFLGDMIRVLIWNIGTIFLARHRLRQSFWISTFHALSYGIFIYSFMVKWGVMGFAIGYMVMNFIVLGVNCFFAARLTGFRVSRQNTGLILSGILLFIFFNWIRHYGLIITTSACSVILLWLVVFIHKEEWFYLRNRITQVFQNSGIR